MSGQNTTWPLKRVLEVGLLDYFLFLFFFGGGVLKSAFTFELNDYVGSVVLRHIACSHTLNPLMFTQSSLPSVKGALLPGKCAVK